MKTHGGPKFLLLLLTTKPRAGRLLCSEKNPEMILHCLKTVDNLLGGFLGTLLNIKIKKKACAQLKVLSGSYPLSLNYLLACLPPLRQWWSCPHCIFCVLVYRHQRWHSLTLWETLSCRSAPPLSACSLQAVHGPTLQHMTTRLTWKTPWKQYVSCEYVYMCLLQQKSVFNFNKKYDRMPIRVGSPICAWYSSCKGKDEHPSLVFKTLHNLGLHNMCVLSRSVLSDSLRSQGL